MSPTNKPHLKRILNFAIVGAIGFVIDSAVYNLQLQLVAADLYQRLFAPFLSFEAAVLSNYALYHHWVWKDRRKETTREYWIGFFHYNMTAGIGFFIKLGIMNLVIEILRAVQAVNLYRHLFPQLTEKTGDVITKNLGNLLGVLIAAVFNFIVVNRLIFKEKRSAPSSGATEE